jgi:hypothetical protein
MSGALAIAGVTATLKDLLNDGLLDHDLSSVGSFSVTAQAPDRITTGSTETNLLNIFLYQITPNLGWRNADLPSRDGRGNRLSNPPLALDLHYLVTAYGTQDMNAEVLLGYAMQLLHETPVITREQLRIVLGTPLPVDGTLVPGRFGTLSAEDLADQVELIKITPSYLTSEELSKLWTAMQARYRPSMAYMVSVVLIQAEGGARVPPPVLQRGAGDRGPQAQAVAPPVLQAVRNPISALLPALRLGDDLSLVGIALARSGTLTALFTNERLGIANELPLSAGRRGERVAQPLAEHDGTARGDECVGERRVRRRRSRRRSRAAELDDQQCAGRAGAPHHRLAADRCGGHRVRADRSVLAARASVAGARRTAAARHRRAAADGHRHAGRCHPAELDHLRGARPGCGRVPAAPARGRHR